MQCNAASCRERRVMKISYMLLNNTGKDLDVPIGAAWQWIHEVEDEEQMRSVFERLKRKTHEDRLTLANLRINERECSDALLVDTFDFKGPALYDKTIAPKRIIHLHEEDNEENLQHA
jgi:alpha-amylase/alpha-mannosidase (GH57 family)